MLRVSRECACGKVRSPRSRAPELAADCLLRSRAAHDYAADHDSIAGINSRTRGGVNYVGTDARTEIVDFQQPDPCRVVRAAQQCGVSNTCFLGRQLHQDNGFDFRGWRYAGVDDLL